MKIDLNNLTKKIIEENEYLTLATVDQSGNPWVCILAYCFDANYNFYFVSLPNSNHSEHIKNNSNVAFTVFDSRQDFGKGVGLQIEGKAKEIDDSELPETEKIYFNRKYPYGNINNEFIDGLKDLLKKKVYRFYKISQTVFWINDPSADTDKRVKVNPRAI